MNIDAKKIIAWYQDRLRNAEYELSIKTVQLEDLEQENSYLKETFCHGDLPDKILHSEEQFMLKEGESQNE